MLGLMKDPEAVEPLCLAMHNPDPLLRVIVVEALGKIGDPAAICRYIAGQMARFERGAELQNVVDPSRGY